MNNNFDNLSLENISPPLKLRRHHAVSHSSQLLLTFFDTKTHEIVYGNPDLSDRSNQNLVKLSFWGSGQCNPNLLRRKQDDQNDRPNTIITAKL